MCARLPMVFSLTALVVAVLGVTPLGEAAYNAVLPRGSVGTIQLKHNAVKAGKLAPNAVRTKHVLDGSLLTEDFKPGQIPQGPKGDKGDKGDPGAQGAPGVSGYQIVTQATSGRPTNTLFTLSASCPAGKRVFGGGVTADVWSLTYGPYVVRSRPIGTGTGWEVQMAFHDAAHSADVTAYAVCGTVT